jgi:YgiT-type zinc finger domain-containing protein
VIAMHDEKALCPDCDAEMEDRLTDVTFARRIVGHPVVVFHGIPAEVCPRCGYKIIDGPLVQDLERMADAYLEGEDDRPMRRLATQRLEVSYAVVA